MPYFPSAMLAHCTPFHGEAQITAGWFLSRNSQHHTCRCPLPVHRLGLFDPSIWCFSGFTGLFPLVIGAIYWRRLPAAGAAVGVLATMITWGTLFYQSEFGLNERYPFPGAGPPEWLSAAIPPLLPVVTIIAVSAIATVGVLLLTRPPDEATQRRFFPESQASDILK